MTPGASSLENQPELPASAPPLWSLAAKSGQDTHIRDRPAHEVAVAAPFGGESLLGLGPPGEARCPPCCNPASPPPAGRSTTKSTKPTSRLCGRCCTASSLPRPARRASLIFGNGIRCGPGSRRQAG